MPNPWRSVSKLLKQQAKADSLHIWHDICTTKTELERSLAVGEHLDLCNVSCRVWVNGTAHYVAHNL